MEVAVIGNSQRVIFRAKCCDISAVEYNGAYGSCLSCGRRFKSTSMILKQIAEAKVGAILGEMERNDFPDKQRASTPALHLCRQVLAGEQRSREEQPENDTDT